jgi:DNA-directed RNA polymerase specialized sigma24 family protein
VRTTATRDFRKSQVRSGQERLRAVEGGWGRRPHFDKLDLRDGELAVVQAISGLPQRQAEVIALTYDGYKPREIARILSAAYPGQHEITSEAVRSSLRHARSRLKRVLVDGGEVRS